MLLHHHLSVSILVLSFSSFRTVNGWSAASKNCRRSLNSVRRSTTNSGSVFALFETKDSFPGGSSSYLSNLSRKDDSKKTVSKLKRDILALAAAYDRGFGATQFVRTKMDRLISDLSTYLGASKDVATGFTIGETNTNAPLNGTWQMVYTSAFDVLSLATPVNTVSAIYQELNPSKQLAVNIIDLIPRFPIPFNADAVLTRLKVNIQATRRGPKRVGLIFESLEIQAPWKQLFPFLPSITLDLPTKYLKNISSSHDSPGYFDVLYVDEDMLIIQQNAPGGCFVSVKVADCS